MEIAIETLDSYWNAGISVGHLVWRFTECNKLIDDGMTNMWEHYDWNIGQFMKRWHISRSFDLEIYWKQQTDWHLNKNIWEHYYWNSGQFLKCCHLWIVSYWNVISRSFVLEFYWKHQSIHAARSSQPNVQMFRCSDALKWPKCFWNE